MGDELDGCECVWSHEYAMQRLLQFIRQSQNHCTDTECTDVLAGRSQQHGVHPTRGGGDEDNNFTIMTMFMVFAVIMYFIRPESILKLTNTKRSTRTNGGQHDPHGDSSPPPPPPPAPPAIH